MRRPLTFLRRVLGTVVVVLLVSSPARADVVCSASIASCGGSFTGGTVMTPIVFPAGTALLPSVAIGQANTGFYSSAVGTILDVSIGGLQTFRFSTNGFFFTTAAGAVTVSSLGNFSWSSGTAGASGADTFLFRETTATIQMGADVNGAAVNQTFKAHDGITGTDILGAGLRLQAGLGTGAGNSNPLTIFRQIRKATGTTAQTYGQAYVTCPAKILSNTSATVQPIATITTTTTTAGSVTLDYAVTANNGTLQNQDSGMVKVSWNNNAGTVAGAMTAVALQSDSDASGTLASTPTATVATNVVTVNLTPTWVTIVPTTVTGYATFTVHATDSVVCQ